MTLYYDEIAASYNELHRDEQLRKVEIIMQRIHPKENDWILDIGCGTGVSCELFKGHKIGIDPSKNLLKIADKNQKDLQTILGQGEDLPFKDNKFDYIISLTAIQNFKDIEKSLKEMKRVIKEDGKLVISTLKKSKKINKIQPLLVKYFKINETIEEFTDIIWFLENK